jgi:hypothetical protein
MKLKIANFNAKDLSEYINLKYTELSGESIEPGVFLRSERSCRRDLLKLGAKFERNKKRPYFEELYSDERFFLKNSTTVHLEHGKAKDGYIDNELILEQFERLFKLLQFKKSFKNKKEMLIVDNASHTAKEYTIMDLV